MGKSDQKTAGSMISNESNRVNNQVGSFTSDLIKERQSTLPGANDERADIRAGMNSYINPYGGQNMDVVNNLRGGNIGYTNSGGSGGSGGTGGNSDSGKYSFDDPYAGYKKFSETGGVDMDRLRGAEGTFKGLMDNGGYDPERIAQVNRSIAALEGMSGPNGGLDDTAVNRFRGNGVYDEFAQNGGWSNQDKQNYRARNNSVMRSQFAQNQQEAKRRALLSGGMGGGNYAAAIAKGARQNAFGMGDANLNAELGLQGQVNAGRQWGAQGMTDAEGKLQALRSNNILQGATGAGNMGISLSNSIAQNKLGGASGYTDMEKGAQGLEQQGKLAGLGGMTNITTAQKQLEEAAASRAASAAAADAARRDANERWIGEMAMRGSQFGNSGLLDLYRSDSGQMQNATNNIFQGMGLQANANQGLIGSQNQLAAMPGTFGSIMGGLGSLTGGAAGIMSGLGSMGYKPWQQTNPQVNNAGAQSNYGATGSW